MRCFQFFSQRIPFFVGTLQLTRTNLVLYWINKPYIVRKGENFHRVCNHPIIKHLRQGTTIWQFGVHTKPSLKPEWHKGIKNSKCFADDLVCLWLGGSTVMVWTTLFTSIRFHLMNHENFTTWCNVIVPNTWRHKREHFQHGGCHPSTNRAEEMKSASVNVYYTSRALAYTYIRVGIE